MRWALALYIVTAMLLAGSDGAWWPWPNVAGVAMIVIMAAVIDAAKVKCRSVYGQNNL